MKLSIIIPVFNEVETIREVVENVLALDCEKEIIIVDDCSTDGTQKIIKELKGDNTKILFHNQNQGRGAAYQTGLRYATGDVVVGHDADFEYNPKDCLKLIEPITRGDADIIYGTRFRGKAQSFLFLSFIANKVLVFFTNLFFDKGITDLMNCYKMGKPEVMRSLNLREKGFELEAEITGKAVRLGYRLGEVPVSFKGRSIAEGKKIRGNDFFLILYNLVKYRFW
jgi:glycosyltransferase involved in cell wall biosynthesis